MGLMDWFSRQTDTKNRFAPTNFGDSGKYQPGAFQYGGSPTGAHEAARQAQQQQQAAIDQQNSFTNQANLGFASGMGGLSQSDRARKQQQEVAAMQMNRARGLVPSIAELQAKRDMQNAVAAQSSAAASARGPAGLALAQQNAANNIANTQSSISGQAQINAAQERMAAEQAAQGAFTGIRQGDLGKAGTAFGAGGQYGGLGAQYGQLGLGYAGLGHQINTTQLGANMQRQGLLAQSHAQGQGLASGVAGANAGTNMQLFGAALGFGEDAAGGIKSAVTRAGGGPLIPGAPHIVGEQGPELIMPTGPGHVFSTPQTMGLLGATTPAGAGPSSGPATPDFGARGGLLGGDAMGELKKHQAVGTKFVRNPMSYGGQ